MSRGLGNRPVFQPQLVHPGETIAGLNAQFRADVEKFRLEFSCVDCVYYSPSKGQCTLGWTVETLCAQPIEILDDKGEPAFCKAV
jgi:hypothetical protein